MKSSNRNKESVNEGIERGAGGITVNLYMYIYINRTLFISVHFVYKENDEHDAW